MTQLALFPKDQQIAKETLIIIGNGFDLAHGIESRYWDFYEWLRKNGNSHLADMMDVFFSNKRDVWSSIEQALGEYDEEAILDYCRPDEEFDLDHSLSSSARVEDSPTDFFKPVLDDFKTNFHDWVNSIEVAGIEKQYSLDPNCLYLTFNYTDTLEKEYNIPDYHIAHIHGSRLKNEEYIIGHNNYRKSSEPWETDGIIFEQQAQENIIVWMNEFTKDYTRNIANHRGFFNGLSQIKQIITYGHSMSKVDWPYFEEIIKVVGFNVPWRISCHSADDISNMNVFQKNFRLSNVAIL